MGTLLCDLDLGEGTSLTAFVKPLKTHDTQPALRPWDVSPRSLESLLSQCPSLIPTGFPQTTLGLGPELFQA